MDRTTRVAAWFILAVALAVATTTASATASAAQEVRSETIHLTPSQGSGVRGTAALEDAPVGAEVRLNLRGLPEAGIEHINHIHGGATCADERAGRGAPATIPLKTIVAGEDGSGGATTVLEDITVSELFDTGKERYVLVHSEAIKGQGIPPGIACADLNLVRTADGTAKSGGDADGQAPKNALPDTGGFRPANVLAGAVVLVLLGFAVGGRLARRT